MPLAVTADTQRLQPCSPPRRWRGHCAQPEDRREPHRSYPEDRREPHRSYTLGSRAWNSTRDRVCATSDDSRRLIEINVVQPRRGSRLAHFLEFERHHERLEAATNVLTRVDQGAPGVLFVSIFWGASRGGARARVCEKGTQPTVCYIKHVCECEKAPSWRNSGPLHFPA